MTAEQKALYRDVYHADRRQWQERLNQASGDVERLELQESAFSDKSAWGLGSAQCNVHPKVIQQAFRQGCKLPAYSDVFNDSEFFKTESLGTELLGEMSCWMVANGLVGMCAARAPISRPSIEW